MWIEYTHLSQFSPKTLLKMMVKEPKKRHPCSRAKRRGVKGGLVTDSSVKRKLTPKPAVGESNNLTTKKLIHTTEPQRHQALEVPGPCEDGNVKRC